MHNDPVQWADIRRRVAASESIRGVSPADGIWGDERVPPAFSDSNKCTDTKWR